MNAWKPSHGAGTHHQRAALPRATPCELPLHTRVRLCVLVQTLCAVVAGLLHFSFLAAFTWMCLEGLHLYVLLVRVFEPSWLRVWHALVSGYGLPAILVLCSAIVFPGGYGTMQ